MASKESSLGLFSLSNKRKQSNGLKSHKRGKLQGGKKELKGAKSGKNEVVIEASNIGKEVKSEDSHYVKTLQKALKEVVDENDVLRNRVTKLEALLSAAQDEIEERNEAILELNEAYESALEVINQFEKNKNDQNSDK